MRLFVFQDAKKAFLLVSLCGVSSTEMMSSCQTLRVFSFLLFVDAQFKVTESGQIEMEKLCVTGCGHPAKSGPLCYGCRKRQQRARKQEEEEQQNKSDEDEEKTECAVCLSDVDHVCELPCCHQFCFSCIFTWLRGSDKCPKCKENIGFKLDLIPPPSDDSPKILSLSSQLTQMRETLKDEKQTSRLLGEQLVFVRQQLEDLAASAGVRGLRILQRKTQQQEQQIKRLKLENALLSSQVVEMQERLEARAEEQSVNLQEKMSQSAKEWHQLHKGKEPISFKSGNNQTVTYAFVLGQRKADVKGTQQRARRANQNSFLGKRGSPERQHNVKNLVVGGNKSEFRAAVPTKQSQVTKETLPMCMQGGKGTPFSTRHLQHLANYGLDVPSVAVNNKQNQESKMDTWSDTGEKVWVTSKGGNSYLAVRKATGIQEPEKLVVRMLEEALANNKLVDLPQLPLSEKKAPLKFMFDSGNGATTASIAFISHETPCAAGQQVVKFQGKDTNVNFHKHMDCYGPVFKRISEMGVTKCSPNAEPEHWDIPVRVTSDCAGSCEWLDISASSTYPDPFTTFSTEEMEKKPYQDYTEEERQARVRTEKHFEDMVKSMKNFEDKLTRKNVMSCAICGEFGHRQAEHPKAGKKEKAACETCQVVPFS